MKTEKFLDQMMDDTQILHTSFKEALKARENLQESVVGERHSHRSVPDGSQEATA